MKLLRFTLWPVAGLLTLLFFVGSGFSPISTTESFRYNQLRSLITDPAHPLQSIDELIPTLPQSFKTNYALMYESRSLQAATPLFPRAILYSEDARLILAFSGEPTDPKHETLEIISFNDETASFDFKEITFPKRGTHDPVHFDESPKLCNHCHSAKLHPNWDSYSKWPGAFGSEDFGPVQPKELGYLKTFVNEQSHQGRYQSLLGMAPDDHFYLQMARLNANLTHQLNRLNYQRLYRQNLLPLAEHGYSAAILAALFQDTDGFFKYMGQANDTQAPAKRDALQHDTEQRILSYEHGKTGRMEKLLNLKEGSVQIDAFDLESTHVNRVSTLRYLLETLGQPTEDLWLRRESGSYAIGDPKRGVRNLAYEVLRLMLVNHPDVKAPDLFRRENEYLQYSEEAQVINEIIPQFYEKDLVNRTP